uniref:RING-type domain-containing protein n=1 Tax=Meloidogyne enterolobii TaxID=390850 RepID=A0A6V7XP02_MELEN|nr:unnamed protein product [Meloidogyne enterolobii]CAD2202341.1 unnamed protein product [Meloidogyne enterolobii]
MVSYRFGKCTVCQFRLRPDNIYNLKGCNHTYHRECIEKWIKEGSKNCPRCRATAALTDIRQLFVEEAGDSSDDSSDEFTESKSQINFVKIKNKWIILNGCNDKFNCIDGNGYGKLISDENIEYINCLEGEGGYNKSILVYAESLFRNPQSRCKFLYYFEIECKFEGELDKRGNCLNIGLKNLNKNKYIEYSAMEASIYNEKNEEFKLETVLNKNDIFGCGLVFNAKSPYIFFTQNGEQIGKGILLNNNLDLYKPFVELKCCSVEANFGNNLESKPFKYDISKHLILKEFY